MTRNMRVSMRWCRRSKSMKEKLLKSIRCNQWYLHHSNLSQRLSPLLFCKDMFPAEHLPPAQVPFFAVTPLPTVQSSARPPPPPPPGPPPTEESPPQISQPVTQQQAQLEPSVPSQQSLPSTHRCPDVLGPAAPMTQEYVPHGGVPPPMTPNAVFKKA